MRLREVMFCGKRKQEKESDKTLYVSVRGKTDFWEKREKNQEQGEIARRELISVAYLFI